MAMATPNGKEVSVSDSSSDHTSPESKLVGKGEAGQLLDLNLSDPPDFLNKRFPSWQRDNQTYMIPPVFKAKHHELRFTAEEIEFSELGEQAEYRMFELLKELGKSKGMGMFVFSGFEMRNVNAWGKFAKAKKKKVEIPDNAPKGDSESDFIIFHHSLGIIAIEVKTSETNNISNLHDHIKKAWKQLSRSYDLVMSMSLPDDSTTPTATLPLDRFYKGVIALPTTPKSIVTNNRDKFSSLSCDTSLLFAEDVQDLKAFENWWVRSIGELQPPDTSSDVSATASCQTSFQQVLLNCDDPAAKAYTKALSNMIMVRHLTPITETDCVKDLHQSLITYKFHDKTIEQISSSEFPRLCKWFSKITIDVEKAKSINEENNSTSKALEVKNTLMKKHSLNEQNLFQKTSGLKVFNQVLQNGSFIADDAEHDEVLGLLFAQKYLIFFRPILEYFTRMREKSNSTVDHLDESKLISQQQMYPFTKMETLLDVNKLGQHLQGRKYIIGDHPSEIDEYLFKSLTHQLRLKYSHFSMVMTTEQLVVFEGCKKQLIIGPPGSGKTELLKFKAKEQGEKIKASKSQTRILFIVGNGSSDPKFNESLVYRRIKEFFSKQSSVVDVIAISVEEEHPDELSRVENDLRNRIASGQYGHVFIDEYWIGSKPPEHKIILELINGIEGYVWITSVFDFNEELLPTNKRMQERTQPLLDTLKKNGGVVNRITQAARGTNHIISLERGYSRLYQKRSYPYGTQEIYGHTLGGLPVQWIVEKTVDTMYNTCVELLNTATRKILVYDSKLKLALNPCDILVVDFAIRTKESMTTEHLYDRLIKRNIDCVNFAENIADLDKSKDKVTLLSSINRDASSYLDGMEWPMVVVILPSGLVRNEVSLATGAQSLRNYDPYISFFRSMVQLTIISDKWTNEKEFLEDVEYKLNQR